MQSKEYFNVLRNKMIFFLAELDEKIDTTLYMRLDQEDSNIKD